MSFSRYVVGLMSFSQSICNWINVFQFICNCIDGFKLKEKIENLEEPSKIENINLETPLFI